MGKMGLNLAVKGMVDRIACSTWLKRNGEFKCEQSSQQNKDLEPMLVR